MSRPAAPVAVVIVGWNSARFLPACLDSLRRLRRPPAEVWYVDNGSTDGSIDLVRDGYAEVRVIDLGENAGFCRGNNEAFRRAGSPFILALNPDTRLEPDFLEELLPAFEEPRVGLAAGKLLRFDGRRLDSCGQLLGRSRQPLDRGYGEPDRGRFDRDEAVFGACGAAALYRREMLESIADPGDQYFDESFFAFYEDLDLAWRARRLGWKAVYRHRAVGHHARGGTAAGGEGPRRHAALLGRAPDARFHAAKNRYLTILRNDTPRGYLLNLPFIWARDLATLGLLLLSSPAVLVRLWRGRAVFRQALERRRLDSTRSRPKFEP